MTTQSTLAWRAIFGHTAFLALSGASVTALALTNVALPAVTAGVAGAVLATFFGFALSVGRRPPHVVTGLLSLLLYPALVPFALVVDGALNGSALAFGLTLVTTALLSAGLAPRPLIEDAGPPLVGLGTYRLGPAPRATAVLAAAALAVVTAIAFIRTDQVSALGLVVGGAAALATALWCRAGRATLDALRPSSVLTAIGALWAAPLVALFSAISGRYVLVPTRPPTSPSEG